MQLASKIRSILHPAGLAAAAMIAASPVALAQPAGAPVTFADLAERLSDAVVNISTSQTVSGRRTIPRPNLPDGTPFQEFFDEFFNRNERGEAQPRRVNSLGSGFVIDPSGLVVTNNHVIEEADEIFVNFNDGRKLKAKLRGADKKTDVALLEIEPDKPLAAVGFGDSDTMRVGDWVLAIGNPFGLGGTVTAGIVSARNRDINSGPYDDFIQTDASINRGNSGGPLFNMNGEVIGINTAIISPSGGSIGIGFAVPTAIALPVLAQLREFGETRRGWLGVRIQTVTDEIAEGLGLPEPRGALVAGVDPKGPAANVDIQAGDVIVKFGGRDVGEMRDLPRIVAESRIGVETDVEIVRKGETITRQVVVARLNESGDTRTADASEESDDGSGDADTAKALGLTLAPLDGEMREKFEIEGDAEGVVITEVDDDSPAGSEGLTAGDMIVAVSQEEVATPADVVRRIDEVRKEGRPRALLLVRNSAGDVRFVAVPLKSDDN